MNTNEIIKRLSEEIIQSINKEILLKYDKNIVAEIIIKIAEFFGNTKFGSNYYIDKFEITNSENKDNEKLFYVKGSFTSHHASEAAYFAFNSNGEYLGCVKAAVCNLVPPNQVEMEYWADENHMNKGNMTILARDVIKEIFEDRAFDNFTMRDGIPASNIDFIMVDINEDNYPSLAVARKLGFDETGILRMSDYHNQIENQPSKGL